MNRRSLTALLFAAAPAAVCMPASAQAVDAARSAVSATFRQMGVPVEGRFARFAGRVVYDPARPADAQARVDVEVASFSLGDPQYDAEVRKPAWFDAARFPRASFAGAGMRPAGSGWQVPGTLTIKGRAVNVVVPLAVRREAGATVFEGSLPIRRLAFGIGEGEWKDTGLLADEVIVKFRLAVPEAEK